MKIGPVNITVDKKEVAPSAVEKWKSLKKTVDKIFDITKDARKEMQAHLDFYNGKIWNEGELRSDDSRATHNLVFSTIQSIAPTLSDNRPIWGVIARQPFMQNLANSYDMAAKYAWDKLEMSMTVHEIVLDAMIQKLGIFFVDFDYNDGAGGEVCIEAQDPKEFFIAPGYTDPWKAPFCGIKGKRPLSMLRKMFGKDTEIKPDTVDEVTDMANRGILYGEADDFELETYFATLYVVWMRDDVTEVEIEADVGPEDKDKPKQKVKKYPNGKFVYFTESVDLGERPSPYSHGKPPWVPYYNYKKPHDFLGTAETDNIKGMAKEFNLQLQKVVGHVRKYHDKNYTVDVSRMADVELVKKTFHNGGNMYAVDQSQDKSDVIKAIDPGMLIPDVYNMLGMIPKMIEEESGATDVSKGIASKKQRQSASEIAVLVESSYTRTRQRVRNLEWSLRRVIWLLINLMQQNYSEMRTFHVKKDEEVITDNISNTNAFAQSTIAPPEVVAKAGTPDQMTDAERQQYDDYQKFTELFGEKDPVYFDFDIPIETNSSLPLDKQSLANLALRLFEDKGIDRRALLETVRFPKGDEIASRMEQAEQMAAQAGGQQGLPPDLAAALGNQQPLDMAGAAAKMGQGVPQ